MTALMLDGFTVGLTADRRWDEQASLFERRGAAVVHGPVIRTLPLGDDEALRRATEAVLADPPAVLIANTGIGIRSWLAAAESWDLGARLLQALGAARIYARGPKASGAVHSLGLDVHAKAPSERLSECVAMVRADRSSGERVVVQRDGGPPPPEAEVLRAAGFDVLEVPIYRWQPADDPRPALRLAEAVIAGRVHAVTFTAAPAVTTLRQLADEAGIAAALWTALRSGDVVVGSVGPACTEAMVEAGLDADHVVQPVASRLGPLVRAVADRLAERVVRRADLVLAGDVLRLGERRVELTATEARVLAALAERAGTVVSKADLLKDVWGLVDADPHLVEVTVGRLRRRLGVDAALVAAVPRRGYILRR